MECEEPLIKELKDTGACGTEGVSRNKEWSDARSMNGVDTPRVPPAVMKSCCFVHQDGSMRFTRLYGSIALLGLPEHRALPMLSVNPMQTEPTTI